QSYFISGGSLYPPLRRAEQFVGYRGNASEPSAVLLRNNGLHIEIQIDRNHRVGATDRAGVSDIVIESALTAIIDLEDSIAAVDATDKLEAYTSWLGVIRGDLTAQYESDGRTRTRAIAIDRTYQSPAGDDFKLPGRAMLMVRNVGLAMSTNAVRLTDGAPA